MPPDCFTPRQIAHEQAREFLRPGVEHDSECVFDIIGLVLQLDDDVTAKAGHVRLNFELAASELFGDRAELRGHILPAFLAVSCLRATADAAWPQITPRATPHRLKLIAFPASGVVRY